MWELAGHSRAIRLFQQSLSSGQLSHAYLLVGPAHVGKSTLARNLAQAVNCESADPPCQECTSCRRIAASKHSDVHTVDLLSLEKKEIGIRQIAEMQNVAHLPPFEGRCKVFIFDRAEMLSHEAANSLLKTLEEPPPNTLMILLTARESALLPTIASRCQRVELRPLPLQAMTDLLVKDYRVAPEKADLLARLSRGCPGWAIAALRDEAILSDREQRMAEMATICSAGTPDRLAYAADLAALFSKSRDKVAGILGMWLEWWRDLLLVKCGNGQWVINADQKARLLAQAEKLAPKSVAAFLRDIAAAGEQLELNANPRLALEVLMLRMP